jgi:superfamily I DNA/RNA helicase
MRQAKLGWEWTDEQTDIFSVIENTDKHVIVNAVSGSGKTTTAIEAAERLPENQEVIFLAFNRNISDELDEKLPDHAEARTIHSLCAKSLYGKYKGDVEVNDNNENVKEALRGLTWKDDGPEHWCKNDIDMMGMGNLLKIISLGRAKLVDLSKAKTIASILSRYNVPLAFRGNKDQSEEERLYQRRLTKHYGGEPLTPHTNETEDAVSRKLSDVLGKVVEILRDEPQVVNYDGMIDCVLNRGDIWLSKYDVVMVDEAQDLTPAEREVVLRASRGGRVIAIGDEMQSLYAWRAADRDSIQNLKQGLMNRDGKRSVIERPLTQTFRCPTKVVDLASTLVPRFRATDDADEGIVQEVTPEEAMENVRPGDFVLSRKNAPLTRWAVQLLMNEQPAFILGKDVGKQLKGKVGAYATNNRALVENILGELKKDMWELAAEYENSNRDEAADAIRDQYKCIKTLAEKVETVQEFNNLVDDIFQEVESEGHALPNNAIPLSTIHRAKGLEAPRVFILQPSELGDNGEEGNVTYVAITRTEQELYFIGECPEFLPLGEVKQGRCNQSEEQTGPLGGIQDV